MGDFQKIQIDITSCLGGTIPREIKPAIFIVTYKKDEIVDINAFRADGYNSLNQALCDYYGFGGEDILLDLLCEGRLIIKRLRPNQSVMHVYDGKAINEPKTEK